MTEQFETFLSQLTATNTTLEYFTDFKKIKRNVNKISIKLNQLNYLIGKENLKEVVEELFDENPKTFNVLDILIAVRKNKAAKTLNSNDEVVNLDDYFTSPALIVEYLEGTGLAEIFKSKILLIWLIMFLELKLIRHQCSKNRGGNNMAKLFLVYLTNQYLL